MKPTGGCFVDHAGVLGGAELSLLDLASAMRDEATVVLLGDGPFRAALEARGIDVALEPMGALAYVKKESPLPSPAALSDSWRVARKVAAHARSRAVLYANSQKAFVVAAAAGLIARRPVVWHLRDILGPPHFSSTNARAVTTIANLRAARVIANSQATADAFVQAGGRESLVRVVHNGIASEPFDAIWDDDAKAERARLGIPDGAFLVALFGRFHAWKGQQFLLEALRDVPNVHALLVGAPLFGEDVYAAALEQFAATPALAGRVHFTGFRHDVPLLMRASDAIVHASVYPEPFGRVIVEGMLAQRPVIASRAGGVPELVQDGETGLLFTPGDPRALAQAIESTRRDPAAAAARVARARAVALSRFTVDAMVAGVRGILAELTSSRP